MSRIIICIPFLLFFALLYPRTEATPEPEPETEPIKVAATGTGELEPLPDPDVLRFIKKCLDRYDREIQGYSGTLYKQERVQLKSPAGIKDVERKPELVRFEFREQPHSVYMKWLSKPDQAAAVVYVEGENSNQLLVRPNSLLSFIPATADPHGELAKSSARYTIDQFGIKKGLERVYKSWTRQKEAHNLHVEYEGVTDKCDQLGNRPCYVIHRTKMPHPEDDGVMDVRLYFDKETWLQVGTQLRDKDGKLIADYFFRDLTINPPEIFAKGHFGRELVNKK